MKKSVRSYWHYLPSGLIILNFAFFYFFGSDVLLKSTYYETYLNMQLPISLNKILALILLLPVFYVFQIIKGFYQNKYIIKNEFILFRSYFLLFLMLFIFYVGLIGFELFNKIFFNTNLDNIMLKTILIKPLFIVVIFWVIYKKPILLFAGNENEIETMGIPNWHLKSKSNVALNPHDKFESIWEIKKLILEIEALINERNVFRREKYNIYDLAIDMYVPVGHLRFLFQEYCDLSFVEYCNYKRVEDFKFYARNKSENQNLTIEAIGGKCGFGSMSSLNRSVKKYENATPSDLWQHVN